MKTRRFKTTVMVNVKATHRLRNTRQRAVRSTYVYSINNYWSVLISIYISTSGSGPTMRKLLCTLLNYYQPVAITVSPAHNLLWRNRNLSYMLQLFYTKESCQHVSHLRTKVYWIQTPQNKNYLFSFVFVHYHGTWKHSNLTKQQWSHIFQKKKKM